MSQPRPPFTATPVSLSGKRVRLDPLSRIHAADLLEAGTDAAIWTYLPRPAFRDAADAQAWIDQAAAEVAAGRQVAYAIVDLLNGRAVGSTRYLDIRPGDRGIEIGWTWLSTGAQRTAINTESKYLLFEHAFERLGAARVQLKTDGRQYSSPSRHIKGRCRPRRGAAAPHGCLGWVCS